MEVGTSSPYEALLNLKSFIVDYKGNICGVDGKVKNYDKKWEPSILNEFGICVKSCPSEGESRVDVYTGDTYTADIKVSTTSPGKYNHPNINEGFI